MYIVKSDLRHVLNTFYHWYVYADYSKDEYIRICTKSFMKYFDEVKEEDKLQYIFELMHLWCGNVFNGWMKLSELVDKIMEKVRELNITLV